ncbi:hypothetical protein B0T18DRAFT_330447 [Schizothecium vesticola]|uniref:DUF6594 domain-containing protein n=1 Tax=Schizothecium vesticola TaxID=314040 RepID=A0AA40K380_9PEZI|nr:hypothetical protein B0T18DRAFT_330447 [Schizothecium vesticola]
MDKDQGYAKVAALMAKHDEFAMFRRFKKLNCLNLLYLQAEIMELEDSLDTLSATDGSEAHRKQFASDWQYLSQKQDNKHHPQWDKVLHLRERLTEYNTTLLNQALLAAHLHPPNPQSVHCLSDWLERPSMGDFPLTSIDRLAWTSPSFTGDLGALRARAPEDPTSRWLAGTALPLFHRVVACGRRRSGAPAALCTYEESRLKRAVDVFATVVAALLPLLSTVTLFLLKTDGQRLGALVVVSAGFAAALALVTNARRVEVFGATAA